MEFQVKQALIKVAEHESSDMDIDTFEDMCNAVLATYGRKRTELLDDCMSWFKGSHSADNYNALKGAMLVYQLTA